ncbi:MAG: hypothetical protein JSS07_02420 [Proteobacteria bacterium]|nr:hypothetical protein [Pseudomonadota bacterium]
MKRGISEGTSNQEKYLKNDDRESENQSLVKLPLSIASKPIFLKAIDFTFSRPKQHGISLGAFYLDSKQQEWLFKQERPQDVLAEFVAGGLFKVFLGENASETQIVIKDGGLMVASKVFSSFSMMSEHQDKSPYCSSFPYGKAFPMKINGKPLKGFMQTLWVIELLHDTDPHNDNVGLIDKGDHYQFAKIDHGKGLKFDQIERVSLGKIINHLKYYYKITPETVGFEESYSSLIELLKIDEAKIQNLVRELIAIGKAYIKEISWKSLYCKENQGLDEDIESYGSEIWQELKINFSRLKRIAEFLRLEKAIIEHDEKELRILVDNNIDLKKKFTPFFQSKYINKFTLNALEIAQLYWPGQQLASPKTVAVTHDSDSVRTQDLDRF